MLLSGSSTIMEKALCPFGLLSAIISNQAGLCRLSGDRQDAPGLLKWCAWFMEYALSRFLLKAQGDAASQSPGLKG